MIARARAFLGTDEALDAVHSLHFKGSVTDQDGKTHELEMIAQKPMQQLITETTPDTRIVTGLDDYDGWRREGPLNRPEVGHVALMSAPEIRLMRARTWQVLYYYHNIEADGGYVTVEGDETIDNVPCVKAVFHHMGGFIFERFFDKATGRLVLTRTDEGAELRELGEMHVAGIRFPKELQQTYERQNQPRRLRRDQGQRKVSQIHLPDPDAEIQFRASVGRRSHAATQIEARAAAV